MSNVYALITGASSGIGLEMARLLAARRYNLIMVSNDVSSLRIAAKEISDAHGVNVIDYCKDLSEKSAAESLYNYTSEHGIEVEILINNAGFFFFGEAVEADTDKASDMIMLHNHTTAMLCRYYGKDMKNRKRGFILNNASISAYKPFPGIAFYASTKSFINYFTRSLRYELLPYGIHVCSLNPGATATNLYDPSVIDVALGKRLGVMLEANKVARLGLEGMFKNKAVIIPGAVTWLMLQAAILTPKWLIYLVRKRVRM